MKCLMIPKRSTIAVQKCDPITWLKIELQILIVKKWNFRGCSLVRSNHWFKSPSYSSITCQFILFWISILIVQITWLSVFIVLKLHPTITWHFSLFEISILRTIKWKFSLFEIFSYNHMKFFIVWNLFLQSHESFDCFKSSS